MDVSLSRNLDKNLGVSGLFSQDTLTKTLLSQNKDVISRGLHVNKKALTAAFITGLIFSVVAGTQFMHFSSANFFPESTPPGIRIEIDGSVMGTNKIQRNGNVYTLTGDIYVTIVVLRDGIVLDGAGYTLQGIGSGFGVFLQERNGVTIKNMKICNFSYGINSLG